MARRRVTKLTYLSLAPTPLTNPHPTHSTHPFSPHSTHPFSPPHSTHSTHPSPPPIPLTHSQPPFHSPIPTPPIPLTHPHLPLHPLHSPILTPHSTHSTHPSPPTHSTHPSSSAVSTYAKLCGSLEARRTMSAWGDRYICTYTTHTRTHAHTQNCLTVTKSLFFSMTMSPTSMLLHGTC